MADQQRGAVCAMGPNERSFSALLRSLQKKVVATADSSLPPLTHLRMPNRATGKRGGAFRIPADRKTTLAFLRSYASAAAEAGPAGMHLLETNDRVGPLKADFDFRFQPAEDAGAGAGAVVVAAPPSLAPRPPPRRRVTREHATALAVGMMKAADRWLEAESVRTWTLDMVCAAPAELRAMGVPDGLSAPEDPYDPRVALVFQRPRPSSGAGKEKDGLHVVFPELVVGSLAQFVMRGHLVRALRSAKKAAHGAGGAPGEGLGALMTSCANDPADVYDRCCVHKNGWMMYGSDKPGKAGNAYELCAVLRIGRKAGDYAVSAVPPAEYVASVVEQMDKRLLRGLVPRAQEILAMAFHLRMRCYGIARPVGRLRRNFAEDPAIHPLVSQGFLPMPRSQAYAEKAPATPFRDYAYAAALVLECLSTERAAREDDWFRVGFALSNLSGGGRTDLLDAWIAWSKRPPQYASVAEADCRNKWRYYQRAAQTPGVSKLGLSSIEEAARSDNPRRFDALQAEHLHERIVSSLKSSDYEIAKVVTRLGNAHLRYKCVDQSARIWYEYNPVTGLWRRDRGRNPLDLHLPEKVYPLMRDIVNKQNDEKVRAARANADDAAEEKANEERKKGVKRLEQLKSNSKMNSVGAVVARLLYMAEFPDKLDQNLDLVGIGCGMVFDLVLGEVRRARPTDMLTLTTGQPFYPPGSRLNAPPKDAEGGLGAGEEARDAAATPPAAVTAAAAAAAEDAAGDECDEYHLEHPDVVAVLKFVAEIFPNEETRHYVLKWLASQFSGHVKDELFHVLIGTGANGKSKLQELMSYTLGSLYATTTIKTFTGQRAEANATNSNYLHIKNKRGVFVQEPGPDESINGGIMKELTGGDKISFRPLYSECQEFRPQATFALVSNYKPKVPAEDMALWRRIRCVRFEREFKANPDPENPLHCQRDDNLASKLPGWAPAFQWYLLTQYYPLYVKEGILRDEQIPPAVYRETEQYRAANDEIVDFVSANIDRVTDAPPPSPVAGAAEAEDEDDIAVARRVEVDTVELCARFTRFVENRRPRSAHIRVAGNVDRVVELFAKRKRWKKPVNLGEGKVGWPQWVWKMQAANMHISW